jgi:hypothetical protein
VQSPTQPQTQPAGQPQTQQPTPAQPAATATPQSPGSPQSSATDAPGTLYAQAIPNGYQLIDIKPKKIMTLLKTSLPDCYLAQPTAGAAATSSAPGAAAAPGGPTGIVFKNNGEWFFEYYKDGALISQKLTIKF